MSHPTVRTSSLNHRSIPEQITGFAILSLCSFAFAFLSTTFLQKGAAWYDALQRPAWSIDPSSAALFFSSLHAILAFCFWMIWRRNSLHILKIELSIFLASFILETIWSASLYQIHQLLPSLIALLLWMCGMIALSALFWKKDKIAGKVSLLSLIYILYLVSINMVICIANNYP